MRLAVYFGRYCAGAVLLTLAGLMVLMVAVSLVENAGRLSDMEAGAASTALRLALYGGVEYAYQVLPVACLIGVLVAGTQMARRGELLAVHAAGVHPALLWAAFVAVVGGLVLAGAAAGELVVPRAVAAVVRIKREQVHQVDALTGFYNRRAHWFRDGELLLYLPSVDVKTRVFTRPVVYRLDRGLIASVIEARTLQHDGTRWWLHDTQTLAVDTAAVVRDERLSLELKVSPTDLIDVAGNPRQMRSSEVRELVKRRTKAGFGATAHLVELHNRAALPLSGLWMALLAMPWALHPERRRSLAVTLGGGVVFIAVELSVTQVFRVLALGHKIPVTLGAWGGGLACLMAVPLSLLLYHRYRVKGGFF